jgi:hypothetical protein
MKPNSKSRPPAVDRRSGRDRRARDIGPPSGRDRRRSLEPRKPEVVEIEVSAEEWAALQAELAPADGKPDA